jgi:hypothetical protein
MEVIARIYRIPTFASAIINRISVPKTVIVFPKGTTAKVLRATVMETIGASVCTK